MPNILTLRGLKSQDIVMDAQLIKSVPIDDTNKAADKVLAYDQPADKLAYVPKCPEIVIKAIQHPTIDLSSIQTSHTVLINQVDMDNTFIIHAGVQRNPNTLPDAIARVELIDSTHIRATRYSAETPQTINAHVVEVTAGINSIQRGTVTFSTESYIDVTITEVDTDKTFVNWLGTSTPGTNDSVSSIQLILLNSTTLRAQRHGASYATVVSYEIVEFI